jgi:hypothetical protein
MPGQEHQPDTVEIFSDDDRRHVEKIISVLEMVKGKGLVGILGGCLPDSGDDYAIATDNTLVIQYFATTRGDEDD